jgi:hypothetical protein
MVGKNFFSVLNPIFQNSIISIFHFLSNLPLFRSHFVHCPKDTSKCGWMQKKRERKERGSKNFEL